MALATWPSTTAEIARLLDCVSRYCECNAELKQVCDSHRMMSDQAALDHLAFVRWYRQFYIDQEQAR